VTVAPGGNDQTKWVELGYFQEIRNEASHRLLVGKFDIYVLEVSESHQVAWWKYAGWNPRISEGL
jgi:hypothetical protein